MQHLVSCHLFNIMVVSPVISIIIIILTQMFLFKIGSLGDSGGPIFQYDAMGAPVVVGVLHGAYGCARGRYPSVFERTSAHVGFFLRHGIKRSYDAVAVFAGDDFVPVDKPRMGTMFLSGTAMVVVMLLAKLCHSYRTMMV